MCSEEFLVRVRAEGFHKREACACMNVHACVLGKGTLLSLTQLPSPRLRSNHLILLSSDRTPVPPTSHLSFTIAANRPQGAHHLGDFLSRLFFLLKQRVDERCCVYQAPGHLESRSLFCPTQLCGLSFPLCMMGTRAHAICLAAVTWNPMAAGRDGVPAVPGWGCHSDLKSGPNLGMNDNQGSEATKPKDSRSRGVQTPYVSGRSTSRGPGGGSSGTVSAE